VLISTHTLSVEVGFSLLVSRFKKATPLIALMNADGEQNPRAEKKPGPFGPGWLVVGCGLT
jgi:hypothetical protein